MMTEMIYQPVNIKYLNCHSCGKQVSSGFIPIPNEIDKENIVVRAWIECPECIEKFRLDSEKNDE